MNLVSITSSGKKWGSGHFGRTIKLVEYLRSKRRNLNTVFITNDNEPKKYLKNKGIKHFKINLKQNNQIINKLETIRPNLIILDTYQLKINFKRKLFDKYKNILVIDDDFKNKQFCKYYLNYNFLNKKNKQNLRKKIKAKKFLIGHNYFLSDLKNNLKKRKKNKVVVFFGSTDKFKIMNKTLKIISNKIFQKFKFYIIIGKYYNLNTSKFKNSNLKFLNTLSSKKFYNLLKTSEYAIGAGGVSLMERVLLGLINFVIVTAKNQTLGVKLLNNKKIIKFAGNANEISYSIYKKRLISFFFNKKKSIVIKKRLRKIKYNKGLDKVYNKISF